MPQVQPSPKTIRKFATDTSWSLVASGSVIGISFIARLLLGNYLDASSLGIYAMVTYIMSLVSFIFMFSLNTTLTKFVAEFKDRPEERNTYISLALIMSLLFRSVAVVVIIAISGWLSEFYNMPELAKLLPIMSIVLPISSIISITVSMFLGLRELKTYAIISIVSSILNLALIAYFLIMGWGLLWVILAIVISPLIMLPALLLYGKKFYRISLANFKSNAKKMLSFSGKIYAANLVAMIRMRADVLIMGYFLVASDVGIYTIALMFPIALRVIPTSMAIVTFPAISEYHGKGMRETIEVLVNKVMKYSLAIVSFLGLILIFFSEQILLLLFPGHPEYLQGVTAIRILSGGMIFWAAIQAVGGCFTAMGRPGIAIIVSTVTAAVAVGLSVLLIKPLGINGAALAGAIALLVGFTIEVVLYKPILKIKLDWVTITKILLITLGCAAFAILLRDIVSWYIAGGLGLLLWLLLILLLKCISRDDIEYLRAIMKR